MSEILISNQINIIKLVRSISTMSLKESKDIVEFWGDTFGYRGPYEVCNFGHIQTLLKMVGKVNKGEWSFIGGELYFSKKVNTRDIFELGE